MIRERRLYAPMYAVSYFSFPFIHVICPDDDLLPEQLQNSMFRVRDAESVFLSN